MSFHKWKDIKTKISPERQARVDAKVRHELVMIAFKKFLSGIVFTFLLVIGVVIPTLIAGAIIGLTLYVGWLVFAMAWLTYQW